MSETQILASKTNKYDGNYLIISAIITTDLSETKSSENLSYYVGHEWFNISNDFKVDTKTGS